MPFGGVCICPHRPARMPRQSFGHCRLLFVTFAIVPLTPQQHTLCKHDHRARDLLLQVLDDVWADFLRDVDGVKTAVGVRTFAHLSPDDEFRLEASKASLHPSLVHGLC